MGCKKSQDDLDLVRLAGLAGGLSHIHHVQLCMACCGYNHHNIYLQNVVLVSYKQPGIWTSRTAGEKTMFVIVIVMLSYIKKEKQISSI